MAVRWWLGFHAVRQRCAVSASVVMLASGVWLSATSLVIAAPPAVQVWRIATGELPPYATQNRRDQGLALNIVRQALQSQGVQVEFVFMPWARAQEETRAGQWDATATWGRRADRERDFLLSDNVLTEQWVVLHRSSKPLDWHKPDDLRGLRMAAISTYTYTPEILAMLRDGGIQADWTPDDMAALNKLAAGRVDIMILDRNVACTLMDSQLPPGQAKLIRAHPRMVTDAFTSHLMLPRGKVGGEERLRLFNRGIAALRSNGSLARLSAPIACAAGLPAPISAAAP